ncbi:MAG: squalene synthase HpnC [Alcaligenaceae bacterium]|nr:squalene synthase HpnC [Alcaligenaceae bacterium]
MAVNHYENFPVASILLPARLRPAVRAVYTFARGADDIADEGDAGPEAREAELDRWRAAVHAIARQRSALHIEGPQRALFDTLAATISEHSLPVQPFLDLLSAFRQDVWVSRYPDEASLLDYCNRSANPVGRIMLHLYRAVDPDRVARSDALCTGLQRANFCQDVGIDWLKGRLYIPEDRLAHHGVDEAYIDQCTQHPPATTSDAWQALMREQVEATRRHLLNGRYVASNLPGRISLELKLVTQGGLAILDKLEASGYNMFAQRPILTRTDWVPLLWRALQPQRPPHPSSDHTQA